VKAAGNTIIRSTVVEVRRFSLNTPGLLKILGGHLYSTKALCIRELLQNAHDACLRRQIEESNPEYRPRITVSLDRSEGTITIKDNGAGLTEQEITDYLSTIGRGYTGELRETAGEGDGRRLIGQFGLGFLSSFLVSRSVSLVTQSYKGGPAWRWLSSGDDTYTVTPSVRPEVGTSVTLFLKPEAWFLCDEDNLAETIVSYADFMPTPIYMAGASEPLNARSVPWRAADPAIEIPRYAERVLGQKELLHWFPLRDWSVAPNGDNQTAPIVGFIYIPRFSLVSIHEHGSMRVHVRGMLICDNDIQLLPSWGRFMAGVIDTPDLQPTASREHVHRDDAYSTAQAAITKQALQEIERLAAEEPTLWRTIVRGHGTLIINWAVGNREFFGQVADVLPLNTSRGEMTLPEYLSQSGGNLYYVTRELGSLQEQLLAEGNDLPAIEAAWLAVEPFLKTYAAMRDDVSCVKLDGNAEALLTPVNQEPFYELLAICQGVGIRARVASFRPDELPCVLLFPSNAELIDDASRAIQGGQMPRGLGGLIQDFVDTRKQEANYHGDFVLNSRNPLVQRLATDPALVPAREAVVKLIYHISRLFGGRMMTPQDTASTFREIGEVIAERLSK